MNILELRYAGGKPGTYNYGGGAGGVTISVKTQSICPGSSSTLYRDPCQGHSEVLNDSKGGEVGLWHGGAGERGNGGVRMNGGFGVTRRKPLPCGLKRELLRLRGHTLTENRNIQFS